jgi:hypothetical protein
MKRVEDEFNKSQALALDAENKSLMTEVTRLRKALEMISAEYPAPTRFRAGNIARLALLMKDAP